MRPKARLIALLGAALIIATVATPVMAREGDVIRIGSCSGKSDEIGVLPEHQRQGIAKALLEVGHAWADTRSLPCALEADVDANIAFYRGRGYDVMASERVPESDLVITAMRRATQ